MGPCPFFRRVSFAACCVMSCVMSGQLLWACVVTGLILSHAVPVRPVPEEKGGNIPSQTAKARAETARWMAHANDWGFVATIDPGAILSMWIYFIDFPHFPSASESACTMI